MLVEVLEVAGGHGTGDGGLADGGELEVGPVVLLDDVGEGVSDGGSVELQLGGLGRGSGGRHGGCCS